MEYYSAIKNEKNAICNNMDETRHYYIKKWSKSEKERQMPYDITYMFNLKDDTNEPIYKTEIESGTYRLIIAKWLGWERYGLGVK